MSERKKTIVLLIAIGVIVIYIYHAITSSVLQPLSPTITAQEVFPMIKAENDSGEEGGGVIRMDVFGQWKSIKLPEEKITKASTNHTSNADTNDVDGVLNQRTSESNPGAQKYAVISSSTPINTQDPNCYNYVFDLPLTVIAWKRIGFRSIVLITGSEKRWETSTVLNLVHSYLKDLDATVVFIEAQEKNLVMLSQTSRLFAFCLEVVKSEDYLITSDSDLWPINAEKYVLPPGKLLLNTYAYCCGEFEHKSEHYRMLPLSSIGTKVSTWREIMYEGNDMNINITAAAILDYFAREFGPMVYAPTQKGENAGWYLDQHMASVRIEHWIQRRNDSAILEFASRNTGRDRLDRTHWYPRNIGSLTDTHLLEHLYRTDQWTKVQPLLHAMYGAGTSFFSLCQRYRQDFVSEIKLSLNVTV